MNAKNSKKRDESVPKVKKAGIRESLRKTSNNIKESYKRFKHRLVYKEIYVEGQEPPKSFSFEKQFIGLYIIFLFYSFVLILAINDPANLLINILTFTRPFEFGISILAFILTLSIILNNDKFRVWLFENHTIIKQIIVYIGIIALYYYLFLFISTNINYITIFLTLSMVWLLLYSSRFYMYSRKFSTKIEARFIKKYSFLKHQLAATTPFFIIIVLVIISLVFRSFLVFVSLDFFASNNPEGAVLVYNKQMRLIMPIIYFSLITTTVFIILEFISTRRRAETKRAGTYDNFTFALIVFFIFFFQIMQVTVFFLIQPETVSALKATVGESSTTVTFIFILEFVISMYFLFRIIKKLGRSIGWRVLFFKRDGLTLFCLACVFAQTLSRFSLSSQIPNQEITDIGVWLNADKFVISVIMIIFLGVTLLVYYLKPHETSMFIRLQKETVSEEEEAMDKIYKIIRSEYIRRGEKYPLEILERELIKATQLSKSHIYSIIRTLVRKEIDIVLSREKAESGRVTDFIDFVSVTERFEKKSVAEKKVKSFMSKRLADTLGRETKALKVTGKLETDKASDQLISSLVSDYQRKRKDEKKMQQFYQETQISFKEKGLTKELENFIVDVMKKEYIYRIENVDKFPEAYYPISVISNRINMATKISPGELYPILEDLQKRDIEFNLLKNPEEPGDKFINFYPIADEKIIYKLANFRPEELSKIRVLITKNLVKCLHTKRTKIGLSKLKQEIPKNTEKQQSWTTILNIFYNNYDKYLKQLTRISDKPKLLKIFNQIVSKYEKRFTSK